jgi:bifunctional DNase/RNase
VPIVKDLVRVELKNLFRAEGAEGGGVLLGNAEKSFAIFIGPGELNALVLAGSGVVPPRPLTHNLLDLVLRRLEIDVKSIVITELVDGSFHASLTLAQGAHEVQIDCRPSDALVLAVMRKKEIFVTRKLLDEVEDAETLLKGARDETADEAGPEVEIGPDVEPGEPPAPAPKWKNRISRYFEE